MVERRQNQMRSQEPARIEGIRPRQRFCTLEDAEVEYGTWALQSTMHAIPCTFGRFQKLRKVFTIGIFFCVVLVLNEKNK